MVAAFHWFRRHGAVGIFMLFTAVPLLLGLGFALAYSLGLVGVLAKGFTTTHWEAVLGSYYFWRSLGFSVLVAALTIGLAVWIAMRIVLRWPRRFAVGAPSILIYFPLAIPAIVMGFFVFQLLSKGGILSRFAYQLGITDGLQAFPDLVNDQWGIGIIIAHFLMATPFFVILYSHLYEHENVSQLSQLAQSLGAAKKTVRRKVVIPILWQRSIATILLYFMFVLGAYEIPLLLGSQSRQMVTVLTIQKLQRYNLADIPQAYTISIAYSIFVFIAVFYMLNKKRLA